MSFRKRINLVVLALGLALPLSVAANYPGDFEARLELSRNGKILAEMTFLFSADDSQWKMESKTRGTRGLARFLGLDEHSWSKGVWLDGAPRPQEYQRVVSAVIKRRWSAHFDWENGKVHTEYPDGESTLDLNPGVLDESALGLVIRAGLAQGEHEWFLQTVDEDEIKQQHFRVSAVKRIDTTLGCMRVHVVEKVRRPGNTRYTRTYYADDYGFAPVRMEHGKPDGDHIEGRIKSLTLDGKAVTRGPACE